MDYEKAKAILTPDFRVTHTSLTQLRPLKPCPFCGGNARVIRIGSGYERLEKPYVAVCQNDDCGASLGQYSATRQEAADRWNNRV